MPPYDDAIKQEVLKEVRAAGSLAPGVQRGIPRRTVSRWAQAAGIELEPALKAMTAKALNASMERQKRLREELRERLIETAVDLVDRMHGEYVDYRGQHANRVIYDVAPADAVRQLATSVGILLDKYRLEMGEATQFHEVKGDGMRSRVAERLDELAKRREQKAG